MPALIENTMFRNKSVINPTTESCVFIAKATATYCKDCNAHAHSAFHPPWDGRMSISFLAEYSTEWQLLGAVRQSSDEPGKLSQ